MRGEHGGADLAVVDGVGEVVAGAGRREVDGELDVDDELLALAPLVVEDAVVAAAADAPTAGCGRASRRLTARSPWPCRRLDHVERVDRRATSCTRTHHTPAGRRARWSRRSRRRARAAGGRAVGVAPAGRRGTSCARRRRAPGGPSATSSSSRRSSAQLCSACLANPRPGSSTTRSRRDAGGDERVDALGQLAHDVGDDVVVDARGRCMSVAVPAPVHRDVRRRRARRPRRSMLGVGQAAADVVDERGAGLDRRRGDLGAHRVDADDRRPSAASAATTGATRRSSSLDARPRRRRAGSTRRRRRRGRRPRRRSSRPCATAASGSSQRPPSENESGVTLTTPMTQRPAGAGERRAAGVTGRSPLAGRGSGASPRRGWRGRAAGRARRR